MSLGYLCENIPRVRKIFRGMLNEGTNCNMNTMKVFFKNQLDMCTSNFEEQVLEENLKEEFGEFLVAEKGKEREI